MKSGILSSILADRRFWHRPFPPDRSRRSRSRFKKRSVRVKADRIEIHAQVALPRVSHLYLGRGLRVAALIQRPSARPPSREERNDRPSRAVIKGRSLLRRGPFSRETASARRRRRRFGAPDAIEKAATSITGAAEAADRRSGTRPPDEMGFLALAPGPLGAPAESTSVGARRFRRSIGRPSVSRSLPVRFPSRYARETHCAPAAVRTSSLAGLASGRNESYAVTRTTVSELYRGVHSEARRRLGGLFSARRASLKCFVVISGRLSAGSRQALGSLEPGSFLSGA